MQKGLLIETMKAFLKEKKNVSRLGLGRKYPQIMTFSEMVSKQRDIRKVGMCESGKEVHHWLGRKLIKALTTFSKV